jgi:hypothetical protein
MKNTQAAVWSTKYKNDLPDSAFLYIEPGGKTDSEGKTTPRSLRHFPYKDADGKIDAIHVRNAISRIPQAKISAKLKTRLQAKARAILAKLRKSGKAFLSDFLSAVKIDRENYKSYTFTSKESAENMAKKLGCKGTQEFFNIDGKQEGLKPNETYYMPCGDRSTMHSKIGKYNKRKD